MTRPVCGAETEHGGHCRAFALDSGRCWNHDPALAEERQAARSKGGSLRALQGKRLKLDTPAALVRFVAGVMQDVVQAKLPPEHARAALYGASIQQRLLETSDLERRLTALEQAAAAGPRRLKR
jgi:hypothetical protein